MNNESIKDTGVSEHEKLHAIIDKSQAIGEFLEWLYGQGLTLCRYHEHTDACYLQGKFGSSRNKFCGLSENDLFPENLNITKLLAVYFRIDLNKLEDEKRSMLTMLTPKQHQPKKGKK